MLNVAIVGMGGIGNTHAGCYKQNPGTTLVAVCDIIKEKADKARSAVGREKPKKRWGRKILVGLGLAGAAAWVASKAKGGSAPEPVRIPTTPTKKAPGPQAASTPAPEKRAAAKKAAAAEKTTAAKKTTPPPSS